MLKEISMTDKAKLNCRFIVGLLLLSVCWLAFLLNKWDIGVQSILFSVFFIGFQLVRSFESFKKSKIVLLAISLLWFPGVYIALLHGEKPLIVNGYNSGLTTPVYYPIPLWLKLAAVLCLAATIFLVYKGYMHKKTQLLIH